MSSAPPRLYVVGPSGGKAAILGIPFTETLHGGQQPGWNWEKEHETGAEGSRSGRCERTVRRIYVERNSSFPTDAIVTIPNGVNDERHRNMERQNEREIGLV